MINIDLELSDENIKKTIEEDLLKRNSKLIMLSKLLSNLDKNIIISIDGKWGSGKTFFVSQFKYLINHIEEYIDEMVFSNDNKTAFNKLHNTSLVVYYNAWENDMHTDVLESLIYNIINEYPSMKNQIVDFADFIKVFKSFMSDFIYASSLETLDINNFDKIKSFKDLSEKIITIEEKKIAFNKLVNEILGDKNRLVLIIDELDRCKPSFAIELLETIKHFYSNDRITVIVSTNNYELSNTIKNYYGTNFDGYGYLNKFYDCIISLDVIDLKEYLQKQFDFCNRTWIYHDMSYLVMNYFNFSLRECNRFITLYNMLRLYIENEKAFDKHTNYIHTCVLLPLVLALKIQDIDKYNLFINKKGKEIILDFLNSEIANSKYESWIIELVNPKNDEDYKQKILDTYYDIFSKEKDFHRFPFFEAISMLGTNLLIEEKSNKE